MGWRVSLQPGTGWILKWLAGARINERESSIFGAEKSPAFFPKSKVGMFISNPFAVYKKGA